MTVSELIIELKQYSGECEVGIDNLDFLEDRLVSGTEYDTETGKVWIHALFEGVENEEN